MRILVWLMILVPLSVAAVSADCMNNCQIGYNECFSSCSQCNCSQEFEWCLDNCQYIDTDGDGLFDPSDNCPDAYNPNQANCDNDSTGDACDSQDNSWTRISIGTTRCAVDEGTKPLGKEIKISYQDIWMSSCTSATCYKKMGKYTYMCSWGSESSNPLQCCRKKRCGFEPWQSAPCPDCDGGWGDYCSYPRCPF